MATDTLKYKLIQSEEQYEEYGDILEKLVFDEENEDPQDEIELLTLLIKDWDERHRLAPEPAALSS